MKFTTRLDAHVQGRILWTLEVKKHARPDVWEEFISAGSFEYEDLKTLIFMVSSLENAKAILETGPTAARAFATFLVNDIPDTIPWIVDIDVHSHKLIYGHGV